MLQSILDTFKTQGEASKRIKLRHKTFWGPPDAERIRNTMMDASDPIEKWKDVRNWQRKLSNKYNAREFAKMHDCKVADLYWKGRDPDKVNFDALPNQYVIRPTIGHSCEKVFLMDHDRNLLDKQLYTKDTIIETMTAALRQNPNLKFLIEEFVRSEQGEYKIPDDYKIHTFNGEIAFIALINRFGRKEGQHNFYDENWNMIKRLHTGYPTAPYQDPPKCLEEMLSYAKKLSIAYEIFVRIDFYATDKGAVFGEFTPTPSLGGGYSRHGEKILETYWNKYCYGMI